MGKHTDAGHQSQQQQTETQSSGMVLNRDNLFQHNVKVGHLGFMAKNTFFSKTKHHRPVNRNGGVFIAVNRMNCSVVQTYFLFTLMVCVVLSS